eukprot:TRINITY_DN3744_c0_g1_i4.p1 TRINITY_DN3744_c0_g1~~TRINITY_DN3744_c0_g1_i4.p1  ORF type:complete len:189 (-),score=21.23 TRINITY_DN3744_c0_g1_i4:72-638(-)
MAYQRSLSEGNKPVAYQGERLRVRVGDFVVSVKNTYIVDCEYSQQRLHDTKSPERKLEGQAPRMSMSQSVKPRGQWPQKCGLCDEVMVSHDCGHSVCLSISCVPAWFNQLRQEHWHVPKSSPGLLGSHVDTFRDRCPACRPEASCLAGVTNSRCCSNIIKRGKCADGAKCDFCHLHGKGGRCRVKQPH